MVALLGIVLYRYGYVRVRAELKTMKEDQAMSMKTLEKYIALISEKPELEKKLVSLTEKRKADNAKLMEAQTPSLVAAALQDAVNGIVKGRGGTITSERVSKPEDLGKFKVITVSMDATFPNVSVLSDTLNAIETYTPSLVVKELDVRIRDFRNPKELMVKLDVSAMTGGQSLPSPTQGGQSLPSPTQGGKSLPSPAKTQPATPKETPVE
jgi:hypothetical protein